MRQKFDSGRLGHAFSRLRAKVVVADLNGDKLDDLAATASGQVVLLYGDTDGLNRGETTDVLTSDSPEIPDVVGTSGTGLSAGDFNGNDRDGLAVGAENSDRLGALFTLQRSANSFTPSTPITLARPGMPDSPEDFLNFGAVSAAGDVDDDRADDLALGFTRVACTLPDCDPVEDDDPPVKGAVVLLPGSSTGLTPTGAQPGAMASHASYWSRLPGKPSCDSRMTGCR